MECRVSTYLSSGPIFLDWQSLLLPDIEGMLISEVSDEGPPTPSFGQLGTLAGAGQHAEAAFTGCLIPLEPTHGEQFVVIALSVTLRERLPDFFRVEALVNDQLAAVSEPFMLAALQEEADQSGDPAVPLTLDLPDQRFSFPLLHQESLPAGTEASVVIRVVGFVMGGEVTGEHEAELALVHETLSPAGGSVVWGVPAGKASQDYTVYAEDNRFSVVFLVSSPEAQGAIFAPDIWSPAPLRLHPLVTHVWFRNPWAASIEGSTLCVEAEYLVSTPDWALPEGDSGSLEASPLPIWNKSTYIEASVLNTGPEAFPNGEDATFPFKKDYAYSPDNLMAVGSVVTLRFRIQQAPGQDPSNFLEIEREVTVAPTLADLSEQFDSDSVVFNPGWVSIGDANAGVFVRFENTTHEDEVPPLLAELRIYEGDPSEETALVKYGASASNPEDNTLIVPAADDTLPLYLRYCVPWRDEPGVITLQVFELQSFDDWLAEHSDDDQNTLIPADALELEPLATVTLEQPLPSLDWYPGGFFSPESLYVLVAEPSEMYSTLFRELPAPNQNVAYWLSTSMAGQDRSALIRLEYS